MSEHHNLQETGKRSYTKKKSSDRGQSIQFQQKPFTYCRCKKLPPEFKRTEYPQQKYSISKHEQPVRDKPNNIDNDQRNATKYTQGIPNNEENPFIYDDFNPPPPPAMDEDMWDLQFCKWWGWNWVKKREEEPCRNNSRENGICSKQCKEQKPAPATAVTTKSKEKKSKGFSFFGGKKNKDELDRKSSLGKAKSVQNVQKAKSSTNQFEGNSCQPSNSDEFCTCPNVYTGPCCCCCMAQCNCCCVIKEKSKSCVCAGTQTEQISRNQATEMGGSRQTLETGAVRCCCCNKPKRPCCQPVVINKHMCCCCVRNVCRCCGCEKTNNTSNNNNPPRTTDSFEISLINKLLQTKLFSNTFLQDRVKSAGLPYDNTLHSPRYVSSTDDNKNFPQPQTNRDNYTLLTAVGDAILSNERTNLDCYLCDHFVNRPSPNPPVTDRDMFARSSTILQRKSPAIVKGRLHAIKQLLKQNSLLLDRKKEKLNNIKNKHSQTKKLLKNNSAKHNFFIKPEANKEAPETTRLFPNFDDYFKPRTVQPNSQTSEIVTINQASFSGAQQQTKQNVNEIKDSEQLLTTTNFDEIRNAEKSEDSSNLPIINEDSEDLLATFEKYLDMNLGNETASSELRSPQSHQK